MSSPVWVTVPSMRRSPKAAAIRRRVSASIRSVGRVCPPMLPTSALIADKVTRIPLLPPVSCYRAGLKPGSPLPRGSTSCSLDIRWPALVGPSARLGWHYTNSGTRFPYQVCEIGCAFRDLDLTAHGFPVLPYAKGDIGG